jgi:hypothetical protein
VGENSGGVGIGDITIDDATEEERECRGGVGIGDTVNEAIEEERERSGGVGRGDIVRDSTEDPCECAVDGDNVCWSRSERCVKIVGRGSLKFVVIFTGGGRSRDRAGRAGGRVFTELKSAPPTEVGIRLCKGVIAGDVGGRVVDGEGGAAGMTRSICVAPPNGEGLVHEGCGNAGGDGKLGTRISSTESGPYSGEFGGCGGGIRGDGGMAKARYGSEYGFPQEWSFLGDTGTSDNAGAFGRIVGGLDA